MTTLLSKGLLFALLQLCWVCIAVHSQTREPVPLWPGLPPGDKPSNLRERDATKPSENLVGGRRLIRLADVSAPTLTFFPAEKSKQTGATVVVFPGGGYNILAMDLEGTEVCEWLNDLGVHAVLVKYRVPRPPAGTAPHARALQDAQRAMGLVRSRAADWGLDPGRIGALGFSAGGHLVATLTASASGGRSYPSVDAADQTGCRPDFQVLVYPAYLTPKDSFEKLSPEVGVDSKTPPTFMVITQDDPVHVESALAYYLALQRSKVPGELHVFPSGGHGYGLRRTGLPVTGWPRLAADWMLHQGIVKLR